MAIREMQRYRVNTVPRLLREPAVLMVSVCSQVLSALVSLMPSSQVVLVPERRLRTVATRESFRKPALAAMFKKGP